jgi:hypothetical protein
VTVKRPKKPPLSQAERYSLDRLVRRGAEALSPEECNRLLLLWEQDKDDRDQERRTAGGYQNANYLLKQQLTALQQGAVPSAAS